MTVILLLWFLPGLIGATALRTRWCQDFATSPIMWLMMVFYFLAGTVGLLAGALVYQLDPTRFYLFARPERF